MSAAPPVRASAEERAELQRTFAALCAILSPSGRERACADLVVATLTRLGFRVAEDEAGAALGGDAGNLLCRLPVAGGNDADPDRGGAIPTVLLCAHLDTVPPLGPVIEPVCRDGVWSDARGGLIGADNKATVAALLAVAARWARHPADGLAVELVFSVQEEPQLRGIHQFDRARLRARCGYVVDHPTPLGGLVVGAPGHVQFDARFRGRAAHAGIAPEEGRSALLAAARAAARLPAGRLASGATVNVGHLAAGATADGPAVTNVVPPYARLLGEVRGPDATILQETVDVVEAILHDAAHDPAGPVDLDLLLEARFSPYTLSPSAVPLRHGTAALERLGIVPRPFADAGGSDANVLNAGGLPTVNLAGGNERAHEAGERISAAALDGTLDLLLTVLDEHERSAASERARMSDA